MRLTDFTPEKLAKYRPDELFRHLDQAVRENGPERAAIEGAITGDMARRRALWPPYVQQLTFFDQDRLGIDRQSGELHWDGLPVVVRRGFRFSFLQGLTAVFVALATIYGELGQGTQAFHDFGCHVGWWTVGCGGK